MLRIPGNMDMGSGIVISWIFEFLCGLEVAVGGSDIDELATRESNRLF